MSSEHATVERLTLPDGAPAGERLYRMFVKDLVLQAIRREQELWRALAKELQIEPQ